VTDQMLILKLRSRRETAAGSGQCAAVTETVSWRAVETAAIICDMWDIHWCRGAAARVAELAPRMNALVAELRRRGVLIVHAPSGTMDFYRGHAGRILAQSAPAVETAIPLQNWVHLMPEREGELPIDDADGGCDDDPPCPKGRPWTRQIATIEIAEGDAITDNVEAYYLLCQRGIRHVLIMGVHENMCVLGRPFGIRQLVLQGMEVALVRDMTDTMYNSRQRPFVDHFAGTELMHAHIEAHWCPTLTSDQIIGGQPFCFAAQRHRVSVVSSPHSMTSRERVLAALNHVPPDRVPLDFGAHRSSGIAALAYPKLRQALGLPPRPVRVYDPVQQLAIIDRDVLDLFGVDTIELGRGFALDEKDWAPWTLPDGTPCLMPAWALPERREGEWVLRGKGGRILGHMPDGALYFEQCSWPFLEDDDLDRLPEALEDNMWGGVASPPGPLVAGPDGAQRLAEGARRLRAQTDRAIVGLFGGNLFENGQFLYRIDNFLMLLAADPPRIHAFLERLTEIHLENLERYLAAVGPYIDIILFGDDLGSQNGPQISPAMYREFFQPRHARLWRRAKELADVKVMLHSCGSIRMLLPDLIAAGLDATNPVQISCAGMEAAGLKRDFGDALTFWGGGCDTQTILSRGTPDQVRQHVRQQIALLRPGGGFVFQQVHNILADVPPQNIIAMFETVNEVR